MLILRRAVAYLIDIAIAFSIAMIPQIILVELTGLQNTIRSGYVMELWVLATISAPVWAYFILTEASDAQASFGKRLLKLRVGAADGGTLAPVQVIGRTALKLLPWEMAHAAALIPEILIYQEDPGFPLGFIAVYALLFAYIGVLIATRGQRTAYDFAVGTVVTAT